MAMPGPPPHQCVALNVCAHSILCPVQVCAHGIFGYLKDPWNVFDFLVPPNLLLCTSAPCLLLNRLPSWLEPQ